jgi:uncharacterized protein (DUF2126 family)
MKNLNQFALAVALVAASASTAVFADGATYEQPQAVASTVTRAQVAAEAAEAQRLNLVARGEISPIATAEQLRAIAQAGERAVATRVAAAPAR